MWTLSTSSEKQNKANYSRTRGTTLKATSCRIVVLFIGGTSMCPSKKTIRDIEIHWRPAAEKSVLRAYATRDRSRNELCTARVKKSRDELRKRLEEQSHEILGATPLPSPLPIVDIHSVDSFYLFFFIFSLPNYTLHYRFPHHIIHTFGFPQLFPESCYLGLQFCYSRLERHPVRRFGRGRCC